jgi:hypothetical protein
MNLGLEALRLTASALKMRRAWKNGDYAEVALQGAGMGLTAVRYSPLCQVKGAVGNATRALVTAGQIGFGLYGAYQGVQQALVQFEKGQYLDGALSLLQATADVYAGTRSCFTGEMLILCGGGKKRADGVGLGDLVWTRDEDDPEGPLVLKRVTARFVRVAPIWQVRLADGQVLRTTMEHPFWVENRREWLAAWELGEGDLVRTEDGRLVAVSSVRDTGVWERVYNWEVEDCHTYFVSATIDADSIWAHNAGGYGNRTRAKKDAPLQNGGVLNAGRYAQTSYSGTFSAEGTRIYSRLAGRPISTIDDLVAAIRAGHISPSQIEVNYIVRPGGRTLILNTRTGQALEQAGIPRSQWNAINRTGDPLYERLLSEQLQRNNLTNSGIANPVLDMER